MGQREERERLKQSQIDRRKGKPSAARATRSTSRKGSDHGGDPPSKPTSVDALILEMHQRARRHFNLQSYASAAFFAEKTLAASGADEDAIFLARIHHASGSYARAHTLIVSRRLDRTSAIARLLAGQCLLATGQVLECLELIGESEDPANDPAISSTGRAPSDRPSAHAEAAAPPEVRALICVLRARAYETLENSPRVVMWYRRALAADPMCAEAFLALTQTGLLTAPESASLAKSLAAPARATAAPPSVNITGLFRVLADPAYPVASLPVPLRRSDDVLGATARRRLAALDFGGAVNIAQSLLSKDPSADEGVVCVLLAALTETGARQELFRVAHSLVDRRPKCGVAWLAVGYYYLASGVPDTARRYLAKATALSPRLAPAWTAMGHAYAAQDESDHALAAYSTAARLYPAAHFPRLCMGIQHARQASLGPACTLFLAAAAADPADPAPLHELGAISFRMGDCKRAAEYFRDAIALWKAGADALGREGEEGKPPADPSGKRAEAEELSLVNLGHCYRRLREFDKAKRCYEDALSLRPGKGSTFVALGLTLHAMKRYDQAIAMYHRALRHSPEDVIANDLLERAMADNVELGPLDRVSWLEEEEEEEDDGVKVLDGELFL